MTLPAGTRLGPHELLAPLGAGGMGEVYRARDTRLGREVAIKVLPSAFSADPDRLRRFDEEARAASALNHPNILTIHDIGSQDGAPYVVSELLEGETLRDRLAAGALPQRKAVAFARTRRDGAITNWPSVISGSSDGKAHENGWSWDRGCFRGMSCFTQLQASWPLSKGTAS